VRPIQQGAFWHLTYTSNFIAPFHPEWMGPASHFWTLAVEEQFYLVWPFIMLFVPRAYLTRVIVGTVALAVLFRALVLTVLPIPMEAGGIFTFATLDSLGGGALLALFHYNENLRPHLPRFMKLCLVAGSAILAACTFFYVYRIGFRVLYTLLCLGVSLVFMVLIEKASRGFSGKAKLLLEHPVVLYTGKISYGLYVYHNFMLAIVLYLLSKTTAATDYRLIAPLSFIATFATAMLSWHFIERPITRLKNRFSRENPWPSQQRTARSAG